MIACAPILVECEEDKVMFMISLHRCFETIQRRQHVLGMGKAYFGTFYHYLGPNNVDDMAQGAEQKLVNITCHNEKWS